MWTENCWSGPRRPVIAPDLLIFLLLNKLPFFKMEMDFLLRQIINWRVHHSRDRFCWQVSHWLRLRTPRTSDATDLQYHNGATPNARQCRQIIRNSSEKVLDEIQITGITNAFWIRPRVRIEPSISTERCLPLNNAFSLTHHFLLTLLLQHFNHWLVLLSEQTAMWGLCADRMVCFLHPKCLLQAVFAAK